jgi:exodeoxyribonuclease VII small subunit
MKKELTYKTAFAELEILVNQLEEGNIDLEKLATKISQANALIAICDKKLRTIEEDTITAAAAAPVKRSRK